MRVLFNYASLPGLQFHPEQTRKAARAVLRGFALVCAYASLAALVPSGALAQTPDDPPAVRQRAVTQQQEQTPAPSPEPQHRTDAPDAEEVDEDEVVRVNSNLVLVPTSVVDGRGRAVTDLKLEDFELRVDGETKPISDLSRAETPVYVALLFDNSKSLSEAREFEKQAAVRFFQSVIRPIDRAAVYSVSTEPKLSQPFTNDVRRLVRTIETFGEPEGATALFDAIVHAAQYLNPLPGRKVIVIVSDGTDTVSDSSFEEALQRALRADTQVYVVQTRQLEEPHFRDTVSEGRLDKLTEQTGGAVYVPQTIDDLDAAFTQISRDLAQQYLISYYPQEERKDKFFRFISVRVKSRPNLRVRARRGFYPVTAQNQAPPPHESLERLDAATRDARPLAETASARPSSSSLPGNSQVGGRMAGTTRGTAGNQGTVSGRTGAVGPTDEEEVAGRRANASPVVQATSRRTEATSPERTSPNLYSGTAPAVAQPTTTRVPSSITVEAKEAKSVSEVTPSPQPSPVTTTATPTAEENSTGRSVRRPVSGGVLNGKAVSLPKPSFPPTARAAGVYGIVTVAVTIDEGGRVVEARAISGPPMLQQAAVSAARQAKFSPTLLSGEPVQVTGVIHYSFQR